jgi:uncharacterized metal-binding protein
MKDSSIGHVIFFSCCGASKAGEIANRAARELARQGIGDVSCLAGIGGHIKGFAEATRSAKNVVVIDGCSTGCAQATLKHARCPVKYHIIVAEAGIDTSQEQISVKEIDEVVDFIKEKLTHGE